MNRLLWLALLVLVPVAGAVDEADAASADERIAAVWHEPAVPEPGQQWQGYIRFEPGHNITTVRYQICNVGSACFAPPTPAMRVDDDTWRFDTFDYRINGQTVAWGDARDFDGQDWRVGTQYFIVTEGQEDTPENWQELPHGIDLADPSCKGRIKECSETHYFAWDLPAGALAGDEQAPGPGLVALMAVFLLAFARFTTHKPGRP